MKAALFNSQGVFQQTISGDPAYVLLPTAAEAGLELHIGDYGPEHRVVDGEVSLRPASPATLDGLTLTNLPAPCTIRINSEEYGCAESTATLSFDQPGTYLVTIEAWPYLDKEFSIDHQA